MMESEESIHKRIDRLEDRVLGELKAIKRSVEDGKKDIHDQDTRIVKIEQGHKWMYRILFVGIPAIFHSFWDIGKTIIGK